MNHFQKGGRLWLDGKNTSAWKTNTWSRFRHQKARTLSFQQFNLLTPLNVKQNIFSIAFKPTKWGAWCDYLVEALGIQ
ncbi:hypothetical protein OK016_25730 [Vibrio chagasii]|nr:hypothetical protein [Vibrio chagasii]